MACSGTTTVKYSFVIYDHEVPFFLIIMVEGFVYQQQQPINLDL